MLRYCIMMFLSLIRIMLGLRELTVPYLGSLNLVSEGSNTAEVTDENLWCIKDSEMGPASIQRDLQNLMQ
jgi:hypothetical protein